MYTSRYTITEADIRLWRTENKLPPEHGSQDIYTSSVRAYCGSVACNATTVKTRLREETWLERCRGLNGYSFLVEMWRKIRTKHHIRPLPHPTNLYPMGKAECLTTLFCDLSSPALFPNATQEIRRYVDGERNARIHKTCFRAADTFQPFTEPELTNALVRKSDTTLSSDKIFYSMLQQLGSTAKTCHLTLYNLSWEEARLPQCWKIVTIQPVPKPMEPGPMRSNFLLSCLGKTVERMVLSS